MAKPSLKVPFHLRVHPKDSFDRDRLDKCKQFSLYYKAGRDKPTHKALYNSLAEARVAEKELIATIPRWGHRPVIYGITDTDLTIFVPDDYVQPVVT